MGSVAALEIFYHGTALSVAISLLHGADLSAVEASRHKIDGPPGFFVAACLADAEFFAARRIRGAVLKYEISTLAMQQLKASTVVQRAIPRGRNSPFFAGDELFVPPDAFSIFNELRNRGEIQVSAA